MAKFKKDRREAAGKVPRERGRTEEMIKLLQAGVNSRLFRFSGTLASAWLLIFGEMQMTNDLSSIQA